MSKYKFYTYTNEKGIQTVAAISTYGGKKVKAVAKCDPRDGYDVEQGKTIAAARCNSKIAHKRRDRAFACYQEAERRVAEAERYLRKMTSYYNEAYDAMREADDELEDILTKA